MSTWSCGGSRPEAKDRLALLEAHGPTPQAFTFKAPFPAPDEASVEPVLDECA